MSGKLVDIGKLDMTSSQSAGKHNAQQESVLYSSVRGLRIMIVACLFDSGQQTEHALWSA